MTSTEHPAGYRKKPFWIMMAGVFFMLAPLCNHVMTLAFLKVPNWYAPKVWMLWAPFISVESWIIAALVFASGVALFFVRRWAWIMAVGTLAFIFLYSIVRVKTFWKMEPVFLLMASVTTLGVLAILYFSRFRQPYMNPRIRWWETKPRYRADIPVFIVDWPHQAVLTDVSLTGALLEWDLAEKMPELSDEALLCLQENLNIPCKVARKTALGYGVIFLKIDREEMRGLKKFMQTLSTDPTLLRR